MSVVQFLPQILLAPWMGAVSDRINRKRLLMAGRVMSVGASGGLAVFFAVTGVDDSSTGAIYIAALIAGVGFSISSPAMNALVPNLVPGRDLFGAVALNSSTANIARAIGPAVGAALYVSIGPAASFGLAGVGHLTFILALLVIRYSPPPQRARDTSVRRGFAYIRSTPLMMVLLACAWGIGFAADVVITLTPPLAVALGEREALVGALASMFGVGALLGLASTTIWQRMAGLPNTAVSGFALTGAGYLLLSLGGDVWQALAAMSIAGYGFLLTTSSLTSRIQLLVPEEFRGRVMAIWGVGFLGSRPVAAYLNGWVADSIGVRVAILMSVAVSITAGILAYFRAPQSEQELRPVDSSS